MTEAMLRSPAVLYGSQGTVVFYSTMDGVWVDKWMAMRNTNFIAYVIFKETKLSTFLKSIYSKCYISLILQIVGCYVFCH